jgi:NCAIR mutase (PurE)-related protein
MTPDRIRAVLDRVAARELAVDEAVEELRHLPFRDLGFARVDSHRELRSGAPEVVYGEGKTPEQIAAIVTSLLDASQRVLVTRVDEGPAREVLSRLTGAGAEATRAPTLEHNPVARTLRSAVGPTIAGDGRVAVVSAGTSDQAVAEEAAETLRFLGIEIVRLTDVGVAGIHRLLASREALGSVRAAIVVAGMEGALPSVVGGLVEVPVIAVPTSVGYGASFGGLAALLAMLNSCAAGVTVVNIDNGFGAAMAAGLILRSDTRAAR